MQLVKKGDTIVEVVFAISIFGFISVLTLSVMQKALATSQLALEMNIARESMDSQAEAIRLLMSNGSLRKRYNSDCDSDDEYKCHFKEQNNFLDLIEQKILKDNESNNITSLEKMVLNNKCNDNLPDNAFAIDIRNENLSVIDEIKNAELYPGIFHGDDTNVIKNSNSPAIAKGIWIEAIKTQNIAGDTKNYNAYDFHIKTCWVSPASSRPVTLATVMRIYDKFSINQIKEANP